MLPSIRHSSQKVEITTSQVVPVAIVGCNNRPLDALASYISTSLTHPVGLSGPTLAITFVRFM
ncbi:MAG TPA: hypothetical protein DCQ08_00410 [Amoebophilaceae bacterium]|nr:hypothetical protein [Amoebophilaceae bacterium]